VQAVTKGAGLVAREHFISQRDLLGDPQQELRRPEPLRRLRRAAIDEADDHVTIQMHINAKLNRLGFERGWLSVGLR
jgi:hypothetical protein